MNADSYWDESGLLKARKYERDGNMFSRTMYYDLFGGRFDADLVHESFLEMYSDGNWAQHPYAKQEQSGIILDKASLDEMTAVFYYASRYHGSNDYFIQHTKVWKYAIYPQVFFFLLACKYKWQWAIHATYIQMMYSTAHIEKAANGKWDTDGALLSLLKIKAFENLRISKSLKAYLVEKNIRLNWASKKGFNRLQRARKNLINGMLSEELEHPLMELVNGQ